MKKISFTMYAFLVIVSIILSSVSIISPLSNSENIIISQNYTSNSDFLKNVKTISNEEESEDFEYGGKNYTSNKEKITEQIRSGLKEKSSVITLLYLAHSSITKENIEEIFKYAFVETESSVEGDYLAHSWKRLGYSAKGSYLVKDGIAYYMYEIAYSVDYYITSEQEAELTAEINRVINSFGFTTSTTDRQKIDKIYDFITNNIVYDYENLNDSEYMLKHTAYAALINKTAVCEGYAMLLYRMSKQCGLDSRVITGSGNTERDERHAWNIVKIDDKYYYLDSTWDAELVEYEYYLRGSSGFLGYIVDDEFLTEEFKKKYPVSVIGLSYKTEIRSEGEFRYIIAGERAIVKHYLGTKSKVTVPSKLGGKSVFAVDEGTFEYNSSVKEITFSEGIRLLCYKGINECSELTRVNFPSTLTILVGRNSNYSGIPLNCDKLSTITVANGNPYICIDNGILYSADYKTLIQCPPQNSQTFVSVPEGIEVIGNYAFESCMSLGHVSLPTTIQNVGHYSFINCYNLASVLVPGKTTKIGNDIFYPNGSLTLYGEENSTSHKYSIDNNIKFKKRSQFKCVNGHKFKKTYQNDEAINYKTYQNICSVCGDKSKVQYETVEVTDSYQINLEFITCEYTGLDIKPRVTSVRVGGKNLTENVDFKITGYSDNLNVGTGKVYIKGIGHYGGTDYATFKITPANIENSQIKGLDSHHIFADHKEIKPDVSVVLNGVELVCNTDYTLQYKDNKCIGNAMVIVKGMGNFVGHKEASFVIEEAEHLQAPANLKLSLSDTNTVTATWASVSGANGYYVYYKPSDNEHFHHHIQTSATSVTVTNLSEGCKYDFMVVPYEIIDNCICLDDDHFTLGNIYTKRDLSAPKNLKLTLSDGYDDINANWDDVPNANGYNVYYKKSSATSYTKYGKVTASNVKIVNLDDATKYVLKIHPCYTVNGNLYEDSSYATANIYTLRDLSAPKTVSANLYGYDDVQVKWSKVTNANGYYVYYKKGSSSYKLAKKTTAVSLKIANLDDGVKYTFKVVPYYVVNSKTYEDSSNKTVSLYTLKKLSTPKVAKSSSKKVKVSWTNISGESGYQISASTSKSATKIVSTYATTSGKSKVVSTKKGKTYYYKVRAYKTVSGKKIYGPWSAVKSYKLK